MYLSPLTSYLLWLVLWYALPGFAIEQFDRPQRPHPLGIDSRKMFCEGELPAGRYGETRMAFDIRTRFMREACHPEPWSAANFTDLNDLCTAHGNPKGNMGGMCSKHSEKIFNDRLARAVLLYEENLEGHCRRYCDCPVGEDEWLAAAQREAIQRKGLEPIKLPEYEDSPRPTTTRPPMMEQPQARQKAKGASLAPGKHLQPQAYYGRSWICTTQPMGRGMLCACRNPRVQGRPTQMERTAPAGRPAPVGRPAPRVRPPLMGSAQNRPLQKLFGM